MRHKMQISWPRC